MKKTRILLATPCYGNMISNGYFLSTIRMIAEYSNDPDIDISIFTLGNESLITRARNVCVATCLKGDYTHLLFIDADIEFEPSTIRRLVEKNTDVACAPYPRKTVKWELLKDPKFIREQTNPQRTLQDLKKIIMNFNIHWITMPPEITADNWAQVKHAATGFMLIKRKVFTRLAKAMPELKYDPDDESEDHIKDHLYSFFDCIKDGRNKYLSEDYAFCERVREKLGGQIWVDLSAQLGHMGTMVYKGF